MFFFMDPFPSITCIIVTISISQFFRELVRDKLPKETLWRLVFLEFIGAFEMTAVAYECSIVYGTGGISMFAIFIFGISYWRGQNWRDVSASPSKFIEDWVTRKISFITLLAAIFAELVGGLMSYRYFVSWYWRIGLTDAHSARLHEGFQDCQSHISAEPIVATCVEAFGVFLFIVLAKLIGRVKYLDGVAGFLNAILVPILVVFAFDISGGYFNPVLASSMQFGCSGSTLFEHLQVYWIAHMVGTVAACGFEELISLAFGETDLYSKLHQKIQ